MIFLARRVASGLAVALVTLAASSAQVSPSSHQAPPSPESVIGFAPCSDYKLATYEEIAAYFRRLDADSPRVLLVDIGKTVEGRSQIMALISSEQNLQRRGRYQEIAKRLALSRNLSDEDARLLSQEGRAIVWIDFGLHSNEVAHAQTAPLLAYRMATDESEEARFIRDNVILLLVPNMNPDGTTLVAKWYMDHLGTPFESSSTPELYHTYVGHDNNRDWFMFNMPESQNVARQLYREWFPQIVYNHHQAAPFPSRIFVPPFAEPMNPHIPPLVVRGINLVGDAMTRRLEQEGKRGAVSRVEFDTWWNGGMRTTPYFHNMIGILTETAHAMAAPAHHDPATFPRAFANGVSTLEPSTFYPSPYLGGTWRLRDSCELMLTASMAVLDIGAKRRTEWLYDIHRMGRDAIRSGAREHYVVPADQWDGPAAVRMVNALRTAGIEVSRARVPFSANGRLFPGGSFVVPGAQPFVAHVRDLLNPQVYPDRRQYPGGPPERPYDITGWTLPMQMGVAVEKIDGTLDADLEPVDLALVAPRVVEGSGSRFLAIDPRTNNAFITVNRLLRRGAAIWRSEQPMRASADEWPAGTFVVKREPALESALVEAARALGVAIRGIDPPPFDTLLRVGRPRVGLYHAWGGNIDEGWTRWLLEQYEFEFASLRDADVRAGGLRDRFDVLLLPQATYDSMRSGLAPGSMPPEYTGGMTEEGIAHLRTFVNQGGTLVTLDSASDLPLRTFELPIQNVSTRADASEFFVPGTLLRLSVDTSHPLAFGMPAHAIGFYAHGPLFEVGEVPTSDGQPSAGHPAAGHPSVSSATGAIKVVAEFARQDLRASGWLLGERFLAGRPAVLEASVGRGRVVLIGFRTQHRGQTHQTFKLLFNAILLSVSANDQTSGRPGLE